MTGVPSGSYMVEVAHPTFVFPKYRVEINSKGDLHVAYIYHILIYIISLSSH